MNGLRAGRGIAGGAHGGPQTMMSDFLRFTGNFLSEAATTTVQSPSDWRGYAHVFGGVFALPLVPLVLAGAWVHFVHEHRFNRDLLYDLVSRPERAERLVPTLAA